MSYRKKLVSVQHRRVRVRPKVSKFTVTLHTINSQYQVFILIVIEQHRFVINRNCWAKLKKLIFLVLLRKN